MIRKVSNCLVLFILACASIGFAQPVVGVKAEPMGGKMKKYFQNGHNLIPFHNKYDKWGYLDATSDSVIVAPKYDDASLFEKGIAKIGIKNPNWTTYDNLYLNGFINTKGEEIFSAQFTGVYHVEVVGNRIGPDELFYLRSVTKADGSTGVIDLQTGKWVIELPNYERIFFYDRRHYLINDKIFYADEKKLTVPKGLTVETVYFASHFFKVKSAIGAVGLYSWDGMQIIDPDYLDFEIDTICHRIVASKIKGGTSIGALRQIIQKGGEDQNNISVDLFDFKGNRLASYNSQYQAMLADDSTACFQIGQKNTYFSLINGRILHNRQSVVQSLPGGYEVFQKNDNEGLRKANGEVIIPANYRNLNFIDSMHIIAETADLHHYIYNIKGDRLFEDPYFECTYLPSLKRFMVSRDGKAGQIDRQGRVIIQLDYSGFSSLSLVQEPPYAVYKDGHNGVIDGYGNPIVPFIYDDIQDTRILDSTSEPYFIVKKGQQYGLMDAHGKWLIRLKYGFVSIMNGEGKNWVQLEAYPRTENRYGLFNLKSKILIEPVYSSVFRYEGCVIAAKLVGNDYTYQLLSQKGIALTDSDFSSMKFQYGHVYCKKGGNYGVLNTKGEVLIPFAYQRIIAVNKDLLLVQQDGDTFYMNINGEKYVDPSGS